jgi:hypothetical protein
VLRDSEAFRDWVARDAPPYTIGRPVEDWIAGLNEKSWQAPSVPADHDNSMRTARLTPSQADVVVVYSVEVGDPDVVDLVWVGDFDEVPTT